MSDARELASNLLSLRGYAQSICEHVIVNFWTRDHSDHTDYHVNKIHEDFRQMAEILGYDVTLKSE